LVETGRLRVCIGGTFPLADVRRAHEAGEASRVAGKLVLTVD
jgi:NADPH:quinone reductase-like Zn-dependent oxidoreductase